MPLDISCTVPYASPTCIQNLNIFHIRKHPHQLLGVTLQFALTSCLDGTLALAEPKLIRPVWISIISPPMAGLDAHLRIRVEGRW